MFLDFIYEAGHCDTNLDPFLLIGVHPKDLVFNYCPL